MRVLFSVRSPASLSSLPTPAFGPSEARERPPAPRERERGLNEERTRPRPRQSTPRGAQDDESHIPPSVVHVPSQAASGVPPLRAQRPTLSETAAGALSPWAPPRHLRPAHPRPVAQSPLVSSAPHLRTRLSGLAAGSSSINRDGLTADAHDRPIPSAAAAPHETIKETTVYDGARNAPRSKQRGDPNAVQRQRALTMLSYCVSPSSLSPCSPSCRTLLDRTRRTVPWPSAWVRSARIPGLAWPCPSRSSG